MEIKTFISRYHGAFGEKAPLPLLFGYSNDRIARTEKIGGCMFKALQLARNGQPVNLNAEVIGCPGGKFYTGFSELPEHVPGFVSAKEKYKQTPEMVVDFVRALEIKQVEKEYLHFIRVDQADSFDDMEGMLFFATPDVLSGLCAWAFYDNNAADTVTCMFGSGCASAITYAVQENRKNGNRTFLGLFDPSVRPYVGENELSFVIPHSRFRQMYQTMPECCLFGTHAWSKVKERINR